MALVFEVKGNVCHDIRRFLAEASHEANYLELSMDGRMDMEPAVRTTDSPDHALCQDDTSPHTALVRRPALAARE